MDLEVWMESCRSDENISQIEHFIKKGIPVRSTNVHGVTGLHVASACGQERTVDVLLRHGANVDAVDKLGWTPVMQAARNGHSALVNKLITTGANVQLETHYGANLLFLATASNDLPTIDAVAKGLSKVNIHKQFQATRYFPLAIAIVFDNMTTIKALLDINSDVNTLSTLRLTPLMIATAVGHPTIVNFLLDNNAQVELSNCVNKTALDMAVLCQNNHIIRLLKGKLAEDEKLTSNRTHMMNLQHHTPTRCFHPGVPRPSPGPHLTKIRPQEGCETRLSTALSPNIHIPHIAPPSYSDHLLMSSYKPASPRCNCPENLDPNYTRTSLSPHFRPYAMYNNRTSSAFQETKSQASTSTHDALWASPKPLDQSRQRLANWGTDIESGYGSSMDQDNLQTSRRPSPYAGNYILKNSPIDRVKVTGVSPKQTAILTPSKNKENDSTLKSRWSGLQRTLSRLKSPKTKRSFSPQARFAEVSPPSAAGSRLEMLLQEMDLARYAPLFIDQELEVETFLKLTEGDLKEIGIDNESCEQIMFALNKLKCNPTILKNFILKR